MNYIENNLLPDETIVYKAQIHWFIFAYPLAIVCLGAWLSSKTSLWVFIGVLLIIAGVLSVIKCFFQRMGTEYAVTNKRVILKSGIIKRDALELVLTKCEGLRISQGILGRMFGFGSIVVTTGNVTNSFDFVSNPMDFKKEINSQINITQMG